MEPRRYTLVPDDTPPASGRPAPEGPAPGPPGPPGPLRRRYSLARVAPSPRSALGVDRLERMEEVVARELSGG